MVRPIGEPQRDKQRSLSPQSSGCCRGLGQLKPPGLFASDASSVLHVSIFSCLMNVMTLKMLGSTGLKYNKEYLSFIWHKVQKQCIPGWVQLPKDFLTTPGSSHLSALSSSTFVWFLLLLFVASQSQGGCYNVRHHVLTPQIYAARKWKAKNTREGVSHCNICSCIQWGGDLGELSQSWP